MMIHRILILFLLFALAGAPAMARQSDRSILDIAADFEDSIARQDEAAFLALFFRDGSPLYRLRPATPGAGASMDDAFSLYGLLIANAEQPGWTFSEPAVRIDETTATLRAGYSFSTAGEVRLHGDMHWQLIETRTGWRIASGAWTLFPASQDIAYLPVEEVTADIEAIVDVFAQSFIDKDRDLFLPLFTRPDAPFISTQPTEPVSRAVAIDALREIALIEAAPHRTEERFYDVEVDALGPVAFMRSRYDFRMGEAITNDGYETWMLIHTPDGWRISSVLWSTSFRDTDAG